LGQNASGMQIKILDESRTFNGRQDQTRLIIASFHFISIETTINRIHILVKQTRAIDVEMEAINQEVAVDDVAEEEEEFLDAAATTAAADREGKANCSKHGPQFTSIEELMVCKAYIKASEDVIHGSKQKITLFKAQLQIAHNRIKKDQEEEDACEASKPSHLKPSGCTVSMVSYPECTGSSIYQLFTKKISPVVIKYMAVANHVHIVFFQNRVSISFTNNSHSFQNPRKSGEDDAAYHA